MLSAKGSDELCLLNHVWRSLVKLPLVKLAFQLVTPPILLF